MKSILGLIATFVIFLSCTSLQEQPNQEQVLVSQIVEDSIDVTAPEKISLYGLFLDSSEFTVGRIRWNQTLSVLLEPYQYESNKLIQIARSSRETYDVRKLKAGKEYTVIHTDDSIPKLRQFIFEPDDRSFVVYNFEDSAYTKLVQKEVETVEREIAISMTSYSSVYDAVLSNGATMELVGKMVDILAWQVYFGRIDASDKFKVIYEEERVSDKPVGIKRIKAIYFQHLGKDYYGIHYAAGEGKEDYYDENGNSLRKTFLAAPLEYYRITSRYSGRRYHPVQKRYKAHLGTDFAAPTGTNILSTGDGVVVEARYGKYNGNFVKIKHNDNFTTQYLHMSRIGRGIRPGVRVRQGQTIGYVGSTGLANGPHVCYRFWKNGRQVDARYVDLPPSEPIDPTKLVSFLHRKNLMMHRLDQIEIGESKVLLANVANK